MKRFRVEGLGNGIDYGVWEAETPDGAIAAMMADAGYKSAEQSPFDRIDLDKWLVYEVSSVIEDERLSR